jgi:hypothetical protein
MLKREEGKKITNYHSKFMKFTSTSCTKVEKFSYVGHMRKIHGKNKVKVRSLLDYI